MNPVVSHNSYYEMDSKIEIKEEIHLTDIISGNEAQFLPKDLPIKMNSDVGTLNDSKMDTKAEIKLEPPFPHHSSVKEKEYVSEDPAKKIKKCGNEYGTGIKLKIKEEHLWPETRSADVPIMRGEIKNETNMEFLLGESPRLSMESISYDSSSESALLYVENSGKSMSFTLGNTTTECKNPNKWKSQESDITEKSIEKNTYSETHGKSDVNEKNDAHRQEKCKKKFIHKATLVKSNLTNKCSICEKNFSTLSNLRKHKLIHEGEKQHKCSICEKRFSHLGSLEIHNLIHEGKKPHECSICQKRFTHLASLKLHHLVHEGKLHKCSICDKGFTCVSRLKRHNLIHEGIKAHKCEVCQKDFTDLSNLKNHKLIHEDKKPYQCNICNKSFNSISNMRRHNLIHEDKKPFKCVICKKNFRDLSYFKRHNFIHLGRKPYQCNVCEKWFTELSHLKRHKLVHEGKKPHKCDICEKTFNQLAHLKRHHLIHEGKKPYTCCICTKSFTQCSHLKRHNLIHEGKNT